MVSVDDVMEIKWQMLDAMDSQMYEWLPWLEGALDAVPEDPTERLEWLKMAWTPLLAGPKGVAPELLEQWYGPETAAKVEFAEAFEICEYGHQPTSSELKRLFPFFPEERV